MRENRPPVGRRAAMMLQLHEGNNEIKEIPRAKTKETSPAVRNEMGQGKGEMRNFLIKALSLRQRRHVVGAPKCFR